MNLARCFVHILPNVFGQCFGRKNRVRNRGGFDFDTHKKGIDELSKELNTNGTDHNDDGRYKKRSACDGV